MIAPSPSAALPDPHRLQALLPRLPLFAGMAPADLPGLMDGVEWFSLPGGWTLLRKGEPSDAMYVVTAGSLGLIGTDGPQTHAVTGRFGAGQTVGEVGLMTGEPRTATLKALRDTELLRITPAVFRRMIAAHPRIMENLGRLVVLRLRQMIEGRPDPAMVGPPRTLALVPVTTRIPCRAMAEALVGTLERLGRRAILVDRYRDDLSTEALHTLEATFDHIVYLSDGEPGRWSRLCLRQADRVLLLARPDGLVPQGLPMETMLLEASPRALELVLLHPQGTANPSPAAPWLDRFRPDWHHHLCLDDALSLARLARHVAGAAVGVVLAGGGARGFAHIGVLRALAEAGIAVDCVGGTSIGGIIGAGLAAGWSLEELEDRVRRSFVDSNPLSDMTVPVTAFVRGRKVTRLLRTHFGPLRIEDLWLPFFCVSANLTQGHETVHRAGPVWQALRSSIAIPGILPPVIRRGEILVDGAVMNNFPVSLMADQARGPVIGIDVEDHEAFATVKGEGWRQADWGILGDTVMGGPGIASLLMRAGTVNSQMLTRTSRARTDLFFAPPLDGIGVADWKTFEAAIEIGYRHAVGVLEAQDLSALPFPMNEPGR